MRFMVMIKANKDTEAGVMPSEQLLTEMGKFNEELVKAGVMLAGEGLHPSSKGARVRFSGNKRTVIDGPFAETKELIAGFWLPGEVEGGGHRVGQARAQSARGRAEIEIRQVFEAEDFGAEFTPELREQEERLRAQAAGQRQQLGETDAQDHCRRRPPLDRGARPRREQARHPPRPALGDHRRAAGEDLPAHQRLP